VCGIGSETILLEMRSNIALILTVAAATITVTTADTSDTFDTVASGEAGASTDVVDACSTAPDVVVVPPLRKKRSGKDAVKCDASCSRGTAQIEK